jgi:hypothetical protein
MLWAAVLRRAVFDYVLYKGSRQHSLEWKRAFQYIFVDGYRRDGGLSFSDVCDLFGWDAGYLQRLTTKLTRSDIKKMEVTQLREDFVFDAVDVVVSQTEKWKTANFAAPFMPLYQYSEEYRERLLPKVIRKETFFLSTPPVVRWQVNTDG